MSFDDCFFLFIALCIALGWIYFIIEALRGNVKWNDATAFHHNSIFDHNHYYHHNNSFGNSPSSGLQHSYSYKDQYNISSGRSPGSQ